MECEKDNSNFQKEVRHYTFTDMLSFRKKMRDNARRLVFIKHSTHAAMHKEKLEVQGYVKDNSIKQCKKKVINTYNRVPPIITRVNMFFFLIFFSKSQLEGSQYSF